MKKQEKIKGNFITPDGGMGTIVDISQEEWYKNPPITLYDRLECDCYKLLCSYAELIGIRLDPEEIDYYMAKELQQKAMEILEENFKIKFPVYSEEKL